MASPAGYSCELTFYPDHSVRKLFFPDAATLNPFSTTSEVKFSLYSKTFQIKGWYPNEKHKLVFYFPPPLDSIKAGIEDAPEALDSCSFSYRGPIELRLPEK
jgi:hypothetical protein